MRIVGNKMYEVCGNCAKIIRLNKPFLGSFHVCTTEEERKKFYKQIASEVKAARNLLNPAPKP